MTINGISGNVSPGPLSNSDDLAGARSVEAPQTTGQSVLGVRKAARPRDHQRCAYCGKPLNTTKRAHAKFCDNKCRAKYWKEQHGSK